MLHSGLKSTKNQMLVCGLLAMSLAGILLTLRWTQCTIMKMISKEENTPAQKAGLSFCIQGSVSVKIPSDAVLNNMTDNQVEDLYWSYINTIQVLCQRIVRVGKMEDGGKEACLDEPFRPRQPCLVYSIGIC